MYHYYLVIMLLIIIGLAVFEPENNVSKKLVKNRLGLSTYTPYSLRRLNINHHFTIFLQMKIIDIAIIKNIISKPGVPPVSTLTLVSDECIPPTLSVTVKIIK